MNNASISHLAQFSQQAGTDSLWQENFSPGGWGSQLAYNLTQHALQSLKMLCTIIIMG